MTNEELITKAKSVAYPMELSEKTSAATVGAALITDKGNLYTGVCIDAPSGLGFCAETSAIAAMVTSGESKIDTIVAVSSDGTIYSPCGRCREIIKQINISNMDTTIILKDKIATLSDLLPYPY